MSGEAVARGAVGPTSVENQGGAFKRASDRLAQVKPKPDQGFRKSIDDAIAVVEAERRAQRERELAEKNRLETARQKALMVREIMVLPLLNDLSADFATDEKKVLANWQVESSGDLDAVFGIASTPALNDGGPSRFVIKAGESVAEQGVALNLSVECTCVDAQHLASGKVRQISEKTKALPIAKFDDLGSQMWFQDQLKECVRMSVLTRMRQISKADAQPAAAPVPQVSELLDAKTTALP